MKTQNLFLVLITVLILTSCNKTQQEKKTSINYDQELFDFGILSNEIDSVYAYVTYNNDGANDLVISNIESSCNCTAPIWNSNPLTKNDKDSILVVIKPTKRGKFFSSIMIHSNAENSPNEIRFKGEIDYLDLLDD